MAFGTYAPIQMTQPKISSIERGPLNPRLLRFFPSRVTVLMCILCSLPISIRAQQEKEKWQRVYTGEESLIEINVSNFSFEPEGILRVRYRTIMSKPETVKETPGAKYKSRLETIDFKSGDAFIGIVDDRNDFISLILKT